MQHNREDYRNDKPGTQVFNRSVHSVAFTIRETVILPSSPPGFDPGNGTRFQWGEPIPRDQAGGSL